MRERERESARGRDTEKATERVNCSGRAITKRMGKRGWMRAQEPVSAVSLSISASHIPGGGWGEEGKEGEERAVEKGGKTGEREERDSGGTAERRVHLCAFH